LESYSQSDSGLIYPTENVTFLPISGWSALGHQHFTGVAYPEWYGFAGISAPGVVANCPT